PEGWTSDGPNTLCYVDQEANDDSEVIDDGGHQAWREGDRGRCPDHLDAERCEFWQQDTEFADAEGNCPDGMEYIPAHLTEIGFGHCQVIAVGTPDTGGSDSGESETDGVVEVVTPEAETEIEAEEVEPAESESASDPSQIGQEALTLEPPAQVDQVEVVTDEVVDTSSTLIVESVEEAAPQYEQSEFEVTALPSTGTGSQNESTMEAV